MMALAFALAFMFGLAIGLSIGGRACKKITAAACEMMVALSSTMKLPSCAHPWQAMAAGNTLVCINRDHKPMQVTLENDALVIREIEITNLNQKPRSAP